MAVDYRGDKFAGYNRPIASAIGNQSHVVLIKRRLRKHRMIRFGENQVRIQQANLKLVNQKQSKAKRKSFKARHAIEHSQRQQQVRLTGLIKPNGDRLA